MFKIHFLASDVLKKISMSMLCCWPMVLLCLPLAFAIMAPLLLRRLASSLTHQVVQVSRLNLILSSPVTSAFRRLCTLTVAQRSPFLSQASVTSIQADSPGSCIHHHGTSLLGQCQHLACIQPSAGMKTKSSLRRRCKDCFFVRRRGHLFVSCKTNPRHKQRQGWWVGE